MKIKKIISALLAGIISISLISCNQSFAKVEKKEDNTKITIKKPKVTKRDIIFIGSSALYRYIIPTRVYKNTGNTSYQMTCAGFQVPIIPYAIEYAAQKYKPQLIVVELRQFAKYKGKFNEKFGRRSLDTMGNSAIRLKAINEAIPKNISKKKFKNDIKKATDIVPEIDTWFFNSKHMKLTRTKLTKKKTKISTEAEELLYDVIDVAKKKKIPIMFTFSPYKTGEGQQEKINYIKALLKKEGYKCIDANMDYKKIGVNYATDFYNGNHMNTYGATKYTKYVTNFIKKNFKIKKRANKIQKKKWEEASSAWETKAKTYIEAIKKKAGVK